MPEANARFVELAVVMHENYDQVQRACGVDIEDDEVLEGCAKWTDPIGEVSDCEVHIVEPSHVDDDDTLTLGHEVLHCMLGLYHEE